MLSIVGALGLLLFGAIPSYSDSLTPGCPRLSADGKSLFVSGYESNANESGGDETSWLAVFTLVASSDKASATVASENDYFDEEAINAALKKYKIGEKCLSEDKALQVTVKYRKEGSDCIPEFSLAGQALERWAEAGPRVDDEACSGAKNATLKWTWYSVSSNFLLGFLLATMSEEESGSEKIAAWLVKKPAAAPK